MTDPDRETHMPDRDDQLPELDDQYEDDWEPVEEDAGALPRRRHRRLVTPLSSAFAAVLVAAAGFYGGVQVEKHQDKSSSRGAGATPTGFAAAARAGGGTSGGGTRGGFGGSGSQGPAAVGSVANKRGSTLYVKDSDGNTVRVKTTSHSKISRSASTTSGAIHPGDTVIVQGTRARAARSPRRRSTPRPRARPAGWPGCSEAAAVRARSAQAAVARAAPARRSRRARAAEPARIRRPRGARRADRRPPAPTTLRPR
jgi:hypothetical protein